VIWALLAILYTFGFGSIFGVFEWPLLSSSSSIFHTTDYSATKGFNPTFCLVAFVDLFLFDSI
jgi:hypothetical protein